jgi:SSS family solute:Na+ symporter
MSLIDWLILVFTLSTIIFVGIYKSRGQKDLKGYFLGNNSLNWYKVMFSVMATQASAITFLSAPGQAFTDGMRFVQYYFGLPLAIIVVVVFLVPMYHKLKVITAYEFLEKRFDVRVRVVTAFLFLLQRGLAAGLTIYAPALVMSSLLGWNIYITCISMGVLVVFYTLSGGAKAVAYTQLQQMLVILGGMFFAGWMVFHLMPKDIGFSDTLKIAGNAGMLNVIVTDFNWSEKYNIWSGLLGGFFLALSYFGTDQSQVGRYLSGKSIKESTQGLLMNAFIKIPMQFGILFIGVALFVFYIFNPQPLVFNTQLTEKVKQTELASKYQALENEFDELNLELRKISLESLEKKHESYDVADLKLQMKALRDSGKATIKEALPGADTNDTNYIFLSFILAYLPVGFVGLLIAVLFSASWSSTSSELNALSGTFVIDFYKRLIKKEADEMHYVRVSKWATAFWGLMAIVFSFLATQLDSLIEAVNLLGSLFYGTILGVFVTAFIGKKLHPTAVFAGIIIAEFLVILLYLNDVMGFLWLNPVGCISVYISAVVIHYVIFKNNPKRTEI